MYQYPGDTSFFKFAILNSTKIEILHSILWRFLTKGLKDTITNTTYLTTNCNFEWLIHFNVLRMVKATFSKSSGAARIWILYRSPPLENAKNFRHWGLVKIFKNVSPCQFPLEKNPGLPNSLDNFSVRHNPLLFSYLHYFWL